MRALLDTHALPWWLADDPALTPTAARLISDPANTALVSAVSGGELAAKVRTVGGRFCDKSIDSKRR